MTDIKLPVGRLIQGHPLVLKPVKDKDTGQQKLMADGSPMNKTYVCIAIAKAGETSWQQTDWGVMIHKAGVDGWPNGEHASPVFAWKVEDGDSVLPNKVGKKNCDREGAPGHWLIKCDTLRGLKCFHRGKYHPHEQIQQKTEIKGGDYVEVVISPKGNAGPKTETPGVYINPSIFVLYQAGVEIVGDSGPDAQTMFADDDGVLPPGAAIDPNIPSGGAVPPQGAVPGTSAAAPPPVQGFSTPPPPSALAGYDVGGTLYTREQLITAGWSEAGIDAL